MLSEFARSLIGFTLANDVSRNWALTVIEWIKFECDHNPANVNADLLEGGHSPAIQKCRLCGCTKQGEGEWRL